MPTCECAYTEVQCTVQRVQPDRGHHCGRRHSRGMTTLVYLQLHISFYIGTVHVLSRVAGIHPLVWPPTRAVGRCPQYVKRQNVATEECYYKTGLLIWPWPEISCWPHAVQHDYDIQHAFGRIIWRRCFLFFHATLIFFGAHPNGRLKPLGLSLLRCNPRSALTNLPSENKLRE